MSLLATPGRMATTKNGGLQGAKSNKKEEASGRKKKRNDDDVVSSSNRRTKRNHKSIMKKNANPQHSQQQNHQEQQTRTSTKRKGRKRYNRSGDKIIKMNQKGSNTEIAFDEVSMKEQPQQEVRPLPSLTSAATPWSKLPTYFTCRHTYENTLINEIQRFASKATTPMSGEDKPIDITSCLKAYSPYPGLVCVEDELNLLPYLYDPVYALQTIPNAVVVSGDSIKNISGAIYEALLVGGDGDDDDDDDDDVDDQNTNSVGENKSITNISMLRKKFRSAPKGSLTIHALVPGMCKGQTKPIMLNRSERIGEELSKMLRKLYPAARRKKTASPKKDTVHDHTDDDDDDDVATRSEAESKEMEEVKEKWLLQIMLQSNTIAVASMTQCQYVGPGDRSYWPNVKHPLGLADVNIEEKMPSSAYRKLLEGLECMGIYPSVESHVVDLGASPGGWTSVMRRLGSTVIAVDRSKLDKSLMIDPKVTFVQGDAFSFIPDAWNDHSNDDKNKPRDIKDRWMISDIIAYPERCTELVDFWCKQGVVDNMVVTMKFQGDEPLLEELDNAIDVVEGHGYQCRVKHFFNNKNEVTLMITKLHDNSEHNFDGDKGLGIRCPSIYKGIL